MTASAIPNTVLPRHSRAGAVRLRRRWRSRRVRLLQTLAASRILLRQGDIAGYRWPASIPQSAQSSPLLLHPVSQLASTAWNSRTGQVLTDYCRTSRLFWTR